MLFVYFVIASVIICHFAVPYMLYTAAAGITTQRYRTEKDKTEERSVDRWTAKQLTLEIRRNF